MKRIVLTYFEPFGGRTTNASKEVVSLFNDFEIYELPVSWKRVETKLLDILSNNPDYLFLVGEAKSYTEITIERYAHNIANGIDNDNDGKNDEQIVSGKGTLETKFDLNKVKYHIGENAGKYLCNYSYFLSLINSNKTKVVFIHLPYIEKEGPNSLPNLYNSLIDIINVLSKED